MPEDRDSWELAYGTREPREPPVGIRVFRIHARGCRIYPLCIVSILCNCAAPAVRCLSCTRYSSWTVSSWIGLGQMMFVMFVMFRDVRDIHDIHDVRDGHDKQSGGSTLHRDCTSIAHLFPKKPFFLFQCGCAARRSSTRTGTKSLKAQKAKKPQKERPGCQTDMGQGDKNGWGQEKRMDRALLLFLGSFSRSLWAAPLRRNGPLGGLGTTFPFPFFPQSTHPDTPTNAHWLRYLEDDQLPQRGPNSACASASD